MDDDGHARMLDSNLRERCRKYDLPFEEPPAGETAEEGKDRRVGMNKKVRAAAKRDRIAKMPKYEKQQMLSAAAKAKCDRIANLSDGEKRKMLDAKAASERIRVAKRKKTTESEEKVVAVFQSSVINQDSDKNGEKGNAITGEIDLTMQLLEKCGLADIETTICTKRGVHGPWYVGEEAKEEHARVLRAKEQSEKEGGALVYVWDISHCCTLSHLNQKDVDFHHGMRLRTNYEDGRWREYQDESFYVARDILQRITIDREQLHALADASTGAKKGMKMKRTINVYGSLLGDRTHICYVEKKRGQRGPGPQLWRVHPDPAICNENLRTWKMDIENIADIVEGQVIPDTRPQPQTFEITGEGGTPVYAYGEAASSKYFPCAARQSNEHWFTLNLRQRKKCPIHSLESAEIRINGVIAAGLSEYMSSKHELFAEEYDVTRVFSIDLKPWDQDQFLFLDIKICGPVPGDITKDTCDFYCGDDSGCVLGLIDMAPSTTAVEFPSLIFRHEAKKGHILHDIACTDLYQDKGNNMLNSQREEEQQFISALVSDEGVDLDGDLAKY